MVILVGFHGTLMVRSLDDEEAELLLEMLDIHDGPAGSLLASRHSGPRLDPADLAAIAALSSALRAAHSIAQERWESLLPSVPRRQRQRRAWNATEAYRLIGGEWHIVHSHWAFTQTAKGAIAS